MNLRKQKALAGRALGVTRKRVKFHLTTDDNKKSLKELISREDVRSLMKDEVITKKPKKGISKTRSNHIASQKKKGRRQGQGSRKGTANARHKEKLKWMVKIRALRLMLRNLKLQGKINNKVFRELYQKCKGNAFRNKRHLGLYIQQNNLLKEVEDEK
ncbi:MAG: 50S ribosomal protein L19e [Nanoarchaeota archaeon]